MDTILLTILLHSNTQYYIDVVFYCAYYTDITFPSVFLSKNVPI